MTLANGSMDKQQLDVLPKMHTKNVHHTSIQDDIIQYLHAAAFSPVVSMWVKFIEKGFFVTWPGLTIEKVKKDLPKIEATALGHLDQNWKDQRSMTQQTS